MITVAVAGGTSPGVGRAIVAAIGQHADGMKAIVLGRATSKTPQWLEDMGIEVRKVDYESVESLVAALEGVDTVMGSLPKLSVRI